jgi:hypothetical protein
MEDYDSYAQRARLLTSIHAAKEPEAGTSTSPVELAEGGEGKNEKLVTEPHAAVARCTRRQRGGVALVLTCYYLLY